jgi:hypothetical protein
MQFDQQDGAAFSQHLAGAFEHLDLSAFDIDFDQFW